MKVLITWLQSNGEGSGASLPSERTFDTIKSMSQFVRRNGIKNHSVYVDGRLSILMGNKYYNVNVLSDRISDAIRWDALNTVR